jgi:hypothetical protein
MKIAHRLIGGITPKTKLQSVKRTTEIVADRYVLFSAVRCTDYIFILPLRIPPMNRWATVIRPPKADWESQSATLGWN